MRQTVKKRKTNKKGRQEKMADKKWQTESGRHKVADKNWLLKRKKGTQPKRGKQKEADKK